MPVKPPKPSRQQRNNRKREPQVPQQLGEAWPFQTLPKTLPPGLRYINKPKG